MPDSRDLTLEIFYAGLVVLRASGFADAMLPMAEPRLLAHAARLYGHRGEPTVEWLGGLAEAWRPFRTWCMVLIRLAGDSGTVAPSAGGRHPRPW
jgi:DNA-3-methyladenine glycosylase II